MYKQYNQVLFLITYLLLPGGLDPGQALPSFCSIPCLLSWFDGPRGSGHPDPDFRVVTAQHNQQPFSRSTSRRKTPCHGFHDNIR